MGTFEWRQGRIRLGQESNWRICLDENQFRPTRPQERLLWLPDNRITDYDDEDDYNEDEDDEGDEDDEDDEDNEDNEDNNAITDGGVAPPPLLLTIVMMSSNLKSLRIFRNFKDSIEG